jgi:trk system potassium uptake protein TrkH
VALWHALFHSVSAFCNAGFALHDDSLTHYQGDLVVNGAIGILIVAGGIGFPVILDISRNWEVGWPKRWSGLNLHSKLMLVGTTLLLLVGTVSFLTLEWDGVLNGMPLWKRPMVALFHSISCRTAGFNTVEISSLTNAMLFISILLMAIGAGPCSTAGGFKVSTVAVLVLRAWATFRGRTRVNIARRTLPRETVDRATATAMLFFVITIVALAMLLVIEQSGKAHPASQGLFLDATFEVISALGTVGLSTGMTPHLSTAGRIIVIVLMFIGRLGPISVFIALSRSESHTPVEYPAEEPLIG